MTHWGGGGWRGGGGEGREIELRSEGGVGGRRKNERYR